VLSGSHAVIVPATASKISPGKEESAMIISVTKNCRRKNRKRKDEDKNYPWSPVERRVWIIEAVAREVLAPGLFGGG
jgi:hypothetical protein